MRQIRMSGEDISDLQKGVKFILENPQYNKENKTKITHIKIDKNILTAYSLPDSDFFKNHKDYKDAALSIPVSIDTFTSMAAEWFETANIPDEVEEPDTDGSLNKGFILMYGKNWGDFNWQCDFGQDTYKSGNTVIKMDNIYSIVIIKNYQVYGK